MSGGSRMNSSYLRTSSLNPQQLGEALRGLEQMTRWFKDRKEPPQRALEKIVGYFHRVDRPVYLGYVALEIGYSLDQTQAMCEALHDAGVLRPLTTEEKQSLQIDVRGNLWVLVERAHPSKANW